MSLRNAPHATLGWTLPSGIGVLSVVARLSGPLLGAALLGLAAAAIDAFMASRASGISFVPLFLACVGLTAPVALLLGLLVGAARLLLLPADLGLRLRRWISGREGAARTELGILFALAPLAFVLFLLVSARWALVLLAAELPTLPSGSAVALGVTALGAGLSLAVFGIARTFAAKLTFPVSPLVSLAGALVLAGLFLAAVVATGEPSGGGGALSQFGVLRREELDLRAVGLLLLIALGAGVAPVRRAPAGAALAVALGLLPLGATVHAALRGLEAPAVALAVERSAPFSARSLGPLRSLSDRDGDGFSAWFGGGDCDDRNPEIRPDAEDIPGNSIDEDCSGADAVAIPPPVRPSTPEEVLSEALAAIPESLNVVLLTIDTLRWDLGYMGYARPISPRIDELAKESVVFEQAYALASYTAKSLPPMLIGKYSGETQRGYAHFNRFEASEMFLPERLQRAGIRTISVQGYWYFFQRFGMERGFDVINSSAAPKTVQVEGDRGWTSDKLSDAVIEELGRPGLSDSPFFLWAHYTDPHAEYVEHEGFSFGKDSRARYDSEVAFVDHHVGRVIFALKASGLWDRTALILTSDHGEAFGEHGMIRHGFELWEELVRVPLLVRVPKLEPRRITTRRSLVDLVPTVLDLYRLPAPSGEGTDFVSGVSWMLDLVSPPGHVPEARPIFMDMSEGPHNAERRAFIDGDLKLTTSGGRPLSLYDLVSDPGEKQDLSADRERLTAQLERFKDFRRTLREVRVRRPR